MVEFSRFNESAFAGLPVTDAARIRGLVQFYRDNPTITTEYFFSAALLGYYDCMHDGLNVTAGHIIFRRSDYVDQEERKRMAIYPSETGSIVLDHVGEEAEFFDDGEEDRWDSLEDWRILWQGHHRFIPEYQRLLPGGVREIEAQKRVSQQELQQEGVNNVLATLDKLYPPSPKATSGGNSRRQNNDNSEAKARYWAQKKGKKAKRR